MYLQKETVALANADYEDKKQSGEHTTFRMIERHWKLKAGELSHYRANRLRRKDPGVIKLFKGNARPIPQ